jgi:hypothetical protein
MCTYIYVCIYGIHVYTCVYKAYMCVCVCVCVCIHTICTHTHTIYTYKERQSEGGRESVLFIGTRFSNLYTAVDTPAEAA